MEECRCPPPRGSRKGRNLVVCIDGTSNQFGKYNTNVVELYSKIIKDEDQITYYNSGIGTYARPSWKSLRYVLQVAENIVDLAIAWNFERTIISAYRWLSDNFMENDRIYLFGTFPSHLHLVSISWTLIGFSRGAYQVRALAGMIETVGLIHRGNEEQIPFAYELYSRSFDSEEVLSERFKTTFSREDVNVHFVGVWDTVSSIGMIRGKPLPKTHTAQHICFFRHALALDERRVKFLPEYVHGGESVGVGPVEPSLANATGESTVPKPHIKEVWFPGTHSDIGGGNQLNPTLSLGRTPMLWMSFEAVSCGLRLRPGSKVEWAWEDLGEVRESMHGIWYLLEWLPMKRLTYKERDQTTTRLHRGKGRKIKPGQRVHSSVAFCNPSYHPQAEFTPSAPLSSGEKFVSKDWRNLIGNSAAVSMEEWRDILEMDIFDSSPEAIGNLIRSLGFKSAIEGGSGAKEREDQRMWIYRLQVITSSDEGIKSFMTSPQSICELIEVYHSLSDDSRHLENAEHVLACIVKILEGMCKRKDSFFREEEIQWLIKRCLKTKDPNPKALNLARWWISAGTYSSGWNTENRHPRTSLFDEALRLFLLAGVEKEHLADEYGSTIILGMKNGFLPETFLSEKDILHLLDVVEKCTGQVQKCARKVINGVRRWKNFSTRTINAFLERIDHPDPSVRILVLSILCVAIRDECIVDDTRICDGMRSRLSDSNASVKLEALKLLDACFQAGKYLRTCTSMSIVGSVVDIAVGSEESIAGTAEKLLGSAPGLRFDTTMFQPKLENIKRDVTRRTITLLKSIFGSKNGVFIPEITVDLLWKLLLEAEIVVQNTVVEAFSSALEGPARDLVYTEPHIDDLLATLSSDNPHGQRAACRLLSETVLKDKWAVFPAQRTHPGLEMCLVSNHFLTRLTTIWVCKAYILRDQKLSERLQELLENCLNDHEPGIQDATVELYTEIIPYEAGASLLQRPSVVTRMCHPDITHLRFFFAAVSRANPYPTLFTEATRDMLMKSLSIGVLYDLPMEFFTECAKHVDIFKSLVSPEVKDCIWLRYIEDGGALEVLTFYKAILQIEDLASFYFNGTELMRLNDPSDTQQLMLEKVLAVILANNIHIDEIVTRQIQEYFQNRWSLDGTSQIATLRAYLYAMMGSVIEPFPDHMVNSRLLTLANERFSELGPNWLDFYRKALHHASLYNLLFTPANSAILAQKIADPHPTMRDAAFQFYSEVIEQGAPLRDILLTEEVLSLIHDHLLEQGNMPKRDLAVAFYTRALRQEPHVRSKILTPSIIHGIFEYTLDEPERFQVYTTQNTHVLKFAIGVLGSDLVDLQEQIISTASLLNWNKNLYADNLGEIKSLVVELYMNGVREGRLSHVCDDNTMKSMMRGIMAEHVNGREMPLKTYDPHSWHSNKHILEFLALAISQDDVSNRMFTPESIMTLWPTIRRLGPSLALTEELAGVLTGNERMQTLIYDSLVVRSLCEETDETFREGTKKFLTKLLQNEELHSRLCTTQLREHFPCPRSCQNMLEGERHVAVL